MKRIDRAEILDLGQYEAIRERFRARIIELKRHRRVAVGDHMTLVFENRDTVLFQIQEMLRTERITSEKGIAHEIETYDELLPDDGELSATLFIEYDDKDERSTALAALATLPSHVHLEVGDERASARFLPLPGEEPGRLPAVNYVRFPVALPLAARMRDRSVAARIVVDHPRYAAAAELSSATRASLGDDLG